MSEQSEPSEPEDTATDRGLRLSDPFMPVFLQLLVNVLLVSVINFTVWFAITFFVYLETRSVFATGMIAGIFLVSTIHQHLVRQHRRPPPQEGRHAGLGSGVAGLLPRLVRPLPHHAAGGVHRPRRAAALVLVVLLMASMITGNLRTIALPMGHRPRARAAARPGERAGRHDRRGLVPGDLGDQRAARGGERHVRRARPGPLRARHRRHPPPLRAASRRGGRYGRRQRGPQRGPAGHDRTSAASPACSR